MPLFVNNASTTLAHDVYAVDTPAPATVQATGTDVAVLVGQLPWGPSQQLTYAGSMGELLAKFAPAGMNRLGSAYLSIIRKGWPTLGILRVADPAALASTGTIKQTALTIANVTAIATGTQGNSIILTAGPASDGNVNHFNFTASVSGASGTTSETYPNINLSGVGPDVLPVLTNSVLIGTFVKAAAGVATVQNTAMSGGTDGAVLSPHYVGTPGGSDAGFALIESDDTISHVFTDDPGPSLRAAVNQGLVAHAELTTDRMVYINGPSGQTAAAAQTDVATGGGGSGYRSPRTVYCDPWVYEYDDVTGALQLLPSASFAASVAAQLPPSTSISWRGDAVAGMLKGIVKLESNRGSSRAQNTASGIATFINHPRGGFSLEAGVNTSLTAGTGNVTRTRMGQYMAKSVLNSWQPYVDAPNIPSTQRDLLNSLYIFLDGLKRNSKEAGAAFLPYILDYKIKSIAASNSQAFIQSGNFNATAEVTLGSSMSRIYLNLQFGENVVIQAA